MYELSKDNFIAYFGMESGFFERALSRYSDDLVVYVSETDPVNVVQLKSKLAFLDLNDKKKITYIPLLRDETSSHLMSGVFDRIIVRNKFHHFSYPDEMLKDFKRLLKKNGKLFIVDILLNEQGPPCEFHISREDFFKYLTRNGFMLINETELQYDHFKCLNLSWLLQTDQVYNRMYQFMGV